MMGVFDYYFYKLVQLFFLFQRVIMTIFTKSKDIISKWDLFTGAQVVLFQGEVTLCLQINLQMNFDEKLKLN